MRKIFFIIYLLSVFIKPSIVSAGMLEFTPERNEIKRGLYCFVTEVDGKELVLEIFKNEIGDDLFGLSFDLNFEEDKLEFKDIQLNIKNKQEDYLLISKKEENKIIFAISSKQNNILNFKKNESVIKMIFNLKNNGESVFSFSNVYILQSKFDKKVLKTNNIDLVGGSIFIPQDFPLLPRAGGDFDLSPLSISIAGILFIICFSIFISKEKHIKKYFGQKGN